VFGSDDLWKCFGLCRISFVTSSADQEGIDLGRSCRGRIISVPGLRSVTGLTWDGNVPSQLLLVDNVGVAGLANVVTRIGNRPRRNFGDRSAPVMAILAKTARNNCGSDGNKQNHCRNHHDGEAD